MSKTTVLMCDACTAIIPEGNGYEVVARPTAPVFGPGCPVTGVWHVCNQDCLAKLFLKENHAKLEEIKAPKKRGKSDGK